ncbi:MAG: hypothetical protein M3219_00320 [Thermoproteota archaeon]|nr:hypothetical protein [Thermoproteota archaeon]
MSNNLTQVAYVHLIMTVAWQQDIAFLIRFVDTMYLASAFSGIGCRH